MPKNKNKNGEAKNHKKASESNNNLDFHYEVVTDKKKIDNKFYEKELYKLQIEMIKLQEWVKAKKLKVVVIFEGRDAAGKGGAISTIVQRLNPRFCRVV
ncbi:MAG TPA: hypothetical protein PKW37_01910, partial [Salinivirgaceae bacterium]|nr:hypothetical protein [Salinivirgaceae bacterium]